MKLFASIITIALLTSSAPAGDRDPVTLEAWDAYQSVMKEIAGQRATNSAAMRN